MRKGKSTSVQQRINISLAKLAEIDRNKLLPGRWTLVVACVLLAAGSLDAQSFCGRTLSQWSQQGANIIDRRNASCGQTINGTGGSDLILGTPCDDVIHGRPGSDCIYGFAGNDKLWGDVGDDEIHAGDGNDTLWGDAGNDVLYADAGGDALIGDAGDDRLYGGKGDDQLQGDAGHDELYGGWGDDRLKGDAGQDLLCGQGNNDRLQGDAGRDDLDGGLAADVCDGDSGQNRCFRCETSNKCSQESRSICPDDPNVIEGIADPGCTVCARDLASGTLYCVVAGNDGSFTIAQGEVLPGTREELPADGTFEVFCIRCHGDGTTASPNGQDPLDVRCTRCAGREFRAGTCDLFLGSPTSQSFEPASPSINLYNFLYQNFVLATPNNPRPPLDFDQIPGQGGVPANSPFGHTFVGLPAGICQATLTATLQANNGIDANNDSLNLEIAGATGPFAWGGRLTDLTGVLWQPGALGTAILDLSNLPPSGQNLLPNLADGNLDVYVQDDSGVDCLRLCLKLCTDLALDKKLVSGSKGSWQFALTIRNVGQAPTSGPITVTDTLPASLSFVSGGGNGWSCSASGQTVTCTYSGPPIVAGASSEISLTVLATRNVELENCATVAMEGDLEPSNNRGCVSLPCPDAGPGVHYLEGSKKDPAICTAAGPKSCTVGQTWFWGTCGCGCIDPKEPCPDPADPRVAYISQLPEVCAVIRFYCEPGKIPFTNSCGCGCITPPGYPRK